MLLLGKDFAEFATHSKAIKVERSRASCSQLFAFTTPLSKAHHDTVSIVRSSILEEDVKESEVDDVLCTVGLPE